MNTEQRIDRLTHILYELVDVLDQEGVGPEARLGPEADMRTKLAELKLKLVELLHEQAPL
jgi:hypothetical protein